MVELMINELIVQTIKGHIKTEIKKLTGYD